MSPAETVILALLSTVALALMGVAWWMWRSTAPPQQPPRSEAPKPKPLENNQAGLAPGTRPPEPRVYQPPVASTVLYAPPPSAEHEQRISQRGQEPARTVLYAPPTASATVVYVPPAPSETVLYAPPEPPEPSQTVLYAPPEPSQTVLYAPPEPPEPSQTVLYARPEPSQNPEPSQTEPSQNPFAGTLGTEVVSLDHMRFAPSPGDELEQPTQSSPQQFDDSTTRVISLQQFDDGPTRIISLHELFADKTQSIPREEILALAKAAQAAVRDAARAPSSERPPRSSVLTSSAPTPTSTPAPSAPAPTSKKTRGRAGRQKDFETAARRPPPRGWSTSVTEPEPELEPSADTTAPPPSKKPIQQVPLAKAPELAEAVLIEHFEDAVEALQQTLPSEGEHDLRMLAEQAQARWQSNVDVLKLNAQFAARLVLLPILFNAEQTEDRRLAAALALLSMKGGSGLLDAIEDFDFACHRVVALALAHLDDGVLAESIAAMGSALTQGEPRLEWLGVFARRAADPGPELLHDLLASQERGALAMGLRLLPLHNKASPLAGQIDRHLLSTKPSIRNAALIAGLTLGRPSAWMQCKQAARAPESPEPCLLVATLGTDRDRARLISWAKRAAAPGYAGWALGVSGRLAGILASLELANSADEEVSEHAIAGFNVATGADADSWDAAKAWWDEHGDRFEAGRRYLRGEPLTSASLAAELLQGSLRWREALSLELQIRSRGEVRLPTSFMPSRATALAEQLEELEELGLDFETDYQTRRAQRAAQ